MTDESSVTGTGGNDDDYVFWAKHAYKYACCFREFIYTNVASGMNYLRHTRILFRSEFNERHRRLLYAGAIFIKCFKGR